MIKNISHSTDTFYGIICSGLTDKTQLSFTSSNSSFAECVRQHISSSFSHSNSQCTTATFSQDSACEYSGRGLSYSSGTNTFKNVEFKRCYASIDHGGAIKCTGGTLTVIFSSFSSCNAVGKNGGAIYASSLSLFSLRNSVFDSCGGNYQVDSGGAIALNAVTSPTICESLFFKCKSNENSGAIDMRSSGNDPKDLPIQCSFFLQCECLNGQWPSGGVIEATRNNCGYFSSALFSSCQSNDGGALFLDPPLYTHSICFSFFTRNSATNNYGMDAYFRYNNDQINIFFHSFSTTSSNRVFDVATDQHKTNWLPLGAVMPNFDISTDADTGVIITLQNMD